MSHELRTPLNAVLGFTQLLGMEAHRGQLSPSQLDWIERTHGARKHLLSLVDELLDMARIEARGLEIRSEPVDLAAMARECEGLLAHAALGRDVSVAISVEGQRQMVSSDPWRLRQVLMNLLSNAIKYNRRGGKVEARMRLDGAELRLEVDDTGIGMTAEQTGQLFAPFQSPRQGDRSALPWHRAGSGHHEAGRRGAWRAHLGVEFTRCGKRVPGGAVPP